MYKELGLDVNCIPSELSFTCRSIDLEIWVPSDLSTRMVYIPESLKYDYCTHSRVTEIIIVHCTLKLLLYTVLNSTLQYDYCTLYTEIINIHCTGLSPACVTVNRRLMVNLQCEFIP